MTPHNYVKHPEFNGLGEHVWNYLNDIGRPISVIQKKEGRTIAGSQKNLQIAENSIWHSKSELDEYVAGHLNINPDVYGTDKSRNPFYKAVAGEIRELRRKGILIDWNRTVKRGAGVGIWRLDKTKFVEYAGNRAVQEIKLKNFRCEGLESTVFVRTKQRIFRSMLLKGYKKCVLCGFSMEPYMIGAHIVPYSKMRREEPENSMNPSNGLLLCRLCDVAFENGSIKVCEDFGVEISDIMRESGGRTNQSWLDHVTSELMLPKRMKYPPDPKYLKWKLELVQGKCKGI